MWSARSVVSRGRIETPCSSWCGGELSRDEVAAALGVPVGTVNSRIARARKRLATDLAPLRQTVRTELQLNGEGNA